MLNVVNQANQSKMVVIVVDAALDVTDVGEHSEAESVDEDSKVRDQGVEEVEDDNVRDEDVSDVDVVIDAIVVEGDHANDNL